MIQPMTRRIDISAKTIIFITAFFLSLWIVFQILDIILLLFLAFIFMSALSPLADRISRRGVPRVLAVIIIFVLILASLSGLITVGLTPFINQTSSLFTKLAEVISSLLQTTRIDQSVINQELANLSRELVNFTVDVFRNIISFVTVLVITIYMVLDREKIEHYLTSLFVGRQEKVKKLLVRIEDKLGAWLRGQVILSLIVGSLTFVGLFLLGVEFALPLAIIAGLFEVVPVIGPILAAIPAILVALTISPFATALVTILYFAIQQLEGHLIVPQVMRRAVGLNPILVILAVTVGGRLLGLGGALLAVPIAVVIQLIIQEGLGPDSEKNIIEEIP
ncbi:MAG: AI-2E family transporter [Armatimonadetes bacterium]|nr:MAG: AI-2E family transporter [Armatimonadota bacterium]